MKAGRNKIYLVGIVIAIALFIVFKNKGCITQDRPGQEKPRQEQTGPGSKERISPPPSDKPVRDIGFDRQAGKLIFTRHARCRMACRHIDESEVQEILEKGTVNDRKSEPAARPDPKYALEGRTHDGQQVRIVFAPTNRGMVVITVIDLETDWTCNCN
jgi:hypothetical protein